MAWTFQATRAGYAKMWRSLTIKPGNDAALADKYAALIVKQEAEYRAAEAATGVPWFVIGAIHYRESNCDLKGCLANGERIVGTNKKTTIVPIGRGPYATFADSAIDILIAKGLDKITDWSAARIGYTFETYNGLGYVARGVNSPYLWAGSNHEQAGLYVADHVFDSNAEDKRIGAMTLLARLAQLRPDVAAALTGDTMPDDTTPAMPDVPASPPAAQAPSLIRLLQDPEVLQLISIVIALLRGGSLAAVTQPQPAPAPEPPAGSSGGGIGWLGLIGSVLAMFTGVMGTPAGIGPAETTSATGTIVPALAAGAALAPMLGGTFGRLIGIAGAVFKAIATVKTGNR